MSMFSRFWGITPDMSYEQKRRQKLTNAFYLLSFGACWLNVLDIYLLRIGFWPLFIHVVISFAPLAMLYMNGFNKSRQFALDLFFFITNGWIFYNASVYGPQAGIYFFYFPIIICSFILIPPANKFRMVLYPMLSIGCITLLEITHYSLFYNENLTPVQIQQKYYVMFGITILQVILGSWYMVKVADNNEKLLQKEKLELSRVNAEKDKLNNYIESQNLKLKDELHEKSLELLQRQKHLNQALIEGEEKERKRLSKELHDGLGLLLSTAKIKIQTIESNILEENRIINDALELIDKACIELRLISQNLTPTMLSEIGIEASLRSLIQSINASRYVQIDLITYGLNKFKFSQQMDVQLYRMVLELINNAIKHSYADLITVQLIYDGNILNIQTEDNGKGMLQEKNSIGQGLKNIISTVDIYNGKFNIDTATDKGTTIMISIPG